MCIPLALPHHGPVFPGKLAVGLVKQEYFAKLPENGVFFTVGTVTGTPWGCLRGSGSERSPHQGFPWELAAPTLSPGR